MNLDAADQARRAFRQWAPELAAVLRTHGATLEELIQALDRLPLNQVLIAWEASGALLPLVAFDPVRARTAAVRLLPLLETSDNGA